MVPSKNEEVLSDFEAYLKEPDLAIAVAAVKALTGVIQRSSASTMMELEVQLKAAADLLKEKGRSYLAGAPSISLTAGCEIFLRYVTRCFLDFPDFDVCKSQLIARGEKFAQISSRSRQKIAKLGHSFVRDGAVVLTHGSSRVVLALLVRACKHANFSVFATEGSPGGGGYKVAAELAAEGVPVTVIPDSAVACVMEQVDLVVVGAAGVVENGGVVNQIGTYQIAISAKIYNIPFYVAAECYKFARLYPLTQRDVPQCQNVPLRGIEGESQSEEIKTFCPPCDYTPPSYITLLFSDLGVLTPSAVSDELIKLYQ